MRRSTPRIAVTLVALAAAAAARAGVDVEIGNGDTILGTISPATEVETIRFRAPQDAVLSIKAKAAKKGPALHVVLRNTADQIVTHKDGKSAAITKVVADVTGLYSVDVSSFDGAATGDYSITVAWKSRSSYSQTFLLGGNESATMGFHGDARAAAKLSVKKARQSGADPALVEITPPGAPDGTLSGASATTTLGTTGDYLLRFTGGAPGGAVVVTATIKPPRAIKRKFKLTAAVIGAGDAGGDTAFASVLGPDGGTVTALVPPGSPGAEISGSSVTIPAGALPGGTAIVIATAPAINAGGTTAAAGPTVFFGPEGVRFDTKDPTKVATVTIPFDPAYASTADTLVIYTRDAHGAVTVVPQAPPPYTPYQFNLVDGTCSFKTSHFSSFAAVAPRAAPGSFPTIATITDPEDVCDAFDPNAASPTHRVFYVATGAARTVTALSGPASSSGALTAATWVGGGAQTADGTDRLSFQFVDPVVSVFATNDGKLFVATTRQIFGVDGTGAVNRLAGVAAGGDFGDDGFAVNAGFTSIRNILLDLNGGMFVADEGAHRIRFVNLNSGVVLKWAGNQGGSPSLGADGGNPQTTSFLGPSDLAFAPSGGLYVADVGRVRLLNPFSASGPVNVTVAGSSTGATGSTGDGGKPVDALFTSISSISHYIDPKDPTTDGLVVADRGDHTVRLVNFSTSGTTLLAGRHGTPGFNGDAGSLPGLLDTPVAVNADVAGVVICDKNNQRVRGFLFSAIR